MVPGDLVRVMVNCGPPTEWEHVWVPALVIGVAYIEVAGGLGKVHSVGPYLWLYMLEPVDVSRVPSDMLRSTVGPDRYWDVVGQEGKLKVSLLGRIHHSYVKELV